MRVLVSYAIGCTMGRYSLDEAGIIYAHSGNVDFDPGRYRIFPADADGIIPITDTDWFEDDAVSRVVEFMGVAWGEKSEEMKKSGSEEASIESGTAPTSSLLHFPTSSLPHFFTSQHFLTPRREPQIPGYQPVAQERRIPPRDHPPLPLR